MRQFQYKAVDSTGAMLAGKIEADTLSEAQTRLKQMHPHLISLKEKSEIRTSEGKKATLRELSIFTRQLSLMLGAGMSLRAALEAISKQPLSEVLKAEVQGIVSDTEAGSSFSEALTRRPRTFFPFYVSMVKTGETAGILNQTLERLADHLDAEMVMRQKVKSAFVYPLVMVVVAAAVLSIMTIFVLPRFQEIFTELNAPLPMLTDVILRGAALVRSYWWVMAAAAAGFAYFLRQHWHEMDIQEKANRFVWRIPMTNKTLLPVEMARFCRSVSLLDEGGVPILQSLKVISGTLRSPDLRGGIERAIVSLEEGMPLSTAFEKTKAFPDFLIQMLGVGEKTGCLSAVMSRLATFYDQQVEILLERATALIEPLMIVFLSTVVGTLVVAMLLPIFGLSSAFSK